MEEISSYINGYEKGWKNQALQKLKPENFVYYIFKTSGEIK